MKVIQSGTRFDIYDDSIRSFDRLPVGTYEIHYSQQSGCFLVQRSDLTVNEKTYGVQNEKVEKVLSSFRLFNRSLGVILSGDKGIGKSMFARAVCVAAIKEGYPVIVIDACLPGIAKLISSVDQECLILFDEFDKTFKEKDDRDDQTSLLSLFDGTDAGKKLYIVTCNELYSLSSFIVNRPGRFHYHFRFDYPSPEDITEYLHDHLQKEHYSEIGSVVEFSKKISLNYDCLRSIAFELNLGQRFSDALNDLNIMTTEKERYNIWLYFDNGKQLHAFDYKTNLYDYTDDMTPVWMHDENGDYNTRVYFDKRYVHYDFTRNEVIVKAEGLKFDWDDWDDENDDDKTKNPFRSAKPLYMSFKKKSMSQLHYMI